VLAPVVLVSVVGALEQVDAYQRTSLPRWVTFTPAAEMFARTFNDYAYAPLPVIYGKALPALQISPAAIHDNRFLRPDTPASRAAGLHEHRRRPRSAEGHGSQSRRA
jgi:hypothetical protein